MWRRSGPLAAWLAAGASLTAAALALHGRPGMCAAVALVVVAGAPALLRLRRDALDAAGLAVAFTVAILGLTALAWLGTPLLRGPLLTPEDIRRALLVVAGGTLALTLGAALVPATARPPVAAGSARHVDWRVFAALFAAGGAVTLAGIASGRYGLGTDSATTASSAISLAARTTAFVVLALGLACLTGAGAQHRRLLAVLVVAQVLLGSIGGAKGDALIPLALLGVAALLYGRRVPLRYAVAAVAVALLVLMPANRAMREAVAAHGRSPAAIAESVLSPSQYRPDRALRASTEYLLTRYRQIDSVALIQRDTPDRFARGDGSLYAQLPLIVLLPHAVWSGKPALDVGQQFSHTYWDLPADIKTSTPTTQIGDLVRNFGTAGLLALLVWGAALALATRWWHARRSPRADLVYLVFLAYVATYIEADLPSMFATSSRSLLVAAAIGWLTLPGSRPARGDEPREDDFG